MEKVKKIEGELKWNTWVSNSADDSNSTVAHPQTKRMDSKVTEFYGSPLGLYREYVNYVSKSGFLMRKYDRKNREGIILNSIFQEQIWVFIERL